MLDYFMANHVYDISKAEKKLVYKPKVDLKEGIQKETRSIITIRDIN